MEMPIKSSGWMRSIYSIMAMPRGQYWHHRPVTSSKTTRFLGACSTVLRVIIVYGIVTSLKWPSTCVMFNVTSDSPIFVPGLMGIFTSRLSANGVSKSMLMGSDVSLVSGSKSVYVIWLTGLVPQFVSRIGTFTYSSEGVTVTLGWS